MDCWLWNRSHCPLQQLMRRSKWLRVREKERGKITSNLHTTILRHWVKQRKALIFLSAGEEGCAALQLKSIGQQYSQSCGGVKDGLTDQRTGLYRQMQIKYCVFVCSGQSTGATLFVAGLQSLCTWGWGLLRNCLSSTGRHSFSENPVILSWKSWFSVLKRFSWFLFEWWLGLQQCCLIVCWQLCTFLYYSWAEWHGQNIRIRMLVDLKKYVFTIPCRHWKYFGICACPFTIKVLQDKTKCECPIHCCLANNKVKLYIQWIWTCTGDTWDTRVHGHVPRMCTT